MAAGLGFKDFTTGEVLTAADVDGYLMQGVLVFASSAARDAAITSPQEGQFAFLKDTNTTMYYTGAAWANLDTTGMVNPMTTTGDIIYASSGSTPGRIGIGSTGNVLTVAGGIPSWAAPAGGGKVLQVVTGTYSTELGTSSASYVDTGLSVSITPTLNTSQVLVHLTNNVAGDGASDVRMGLQILRGATQIFEEPQYGNIGVTHFMSTFSPTVLDSPATTSSTTYKLQIKKVAGSASVAQHNNTAANIVLMEIGA